MQTDLEQKKTVSCEFSALNDENWLSIGQVTKLQNANVIRRRAKRGLHPKFSLT